MTYVLAGLTVLPLLVSEGHVASSLGGSTLLLLERLAGGTRADGGVLVEAVDSRDCGRRDEAIVMPIECRRMPVSEYAIQ